MDALKTLQQRIRRLLGQAPEQELPREAVVWGYRLILGREPESEAVVTASRNLKSTAALANSLLRSGEFRRGHLYRRLTETSSNVAKAKVAKSNVASEAATWFGAGRGPQQNVRRFLFIGNCQGGQIANLVPMMTPGVLTSHIKIVPGHVKTDADNNLKVIQSGGRSADIAALVREADLVFLQPHVARYFENTFPQDAAKARQFPTIVFPGFHPDMVHISNAKAETVISPTGGYHSSIALYGWKLGLTPAETLALYSEDIYQHLGFFNYWQTSVDFLVKLGNDTALPIDKLIQQWTRRGVWMHTINHPALFVLADLTRAVLLREGVDFQPDVEKHLRDNLVDQASWTVYPEVARKLGHPQGHYLFTKSRANRPFDHYPDTLNLEEFVHASFEMYGKHGKDDLICPRLATPPYKNLPAFLEQRRKKASPGVDTNVSSSGSRSVSAGKNPYRGLPDHRFWRRAVEQRSTTGIDPVVKPAFTLNRSQKIATAGSCFAQHISRELVRRNFNYYVAEQASGQSAEQAQLRNFGVFSARYGNLYTARQLVQLFDRAYGSFRPQESHWLREDGRWSDPFRPEIEPHGFESVELLEGARAHHLACVRQMFENLDVFVFTLGLTEAWQSRGDGAIFPLAPGVVAGEFDETRYEFVNFRVAEVVSDLMRFMEQLSKVNSHAKVLLTVSPVPLIATYEDRHVLVSTTHSKSVLRAAADEICRSHPERCGYFPSYEMITGAHTRGAYFEDDLRSVSSAGVQHVMQVFLSHYAPDASVSDLQVEIGNVSKIVCEEEAIDAAGAA